MASRMPRTSPQHSTPNISEIETPEPILQWWPVRMALKKFVNYEIRKFVHQVLWPVRLVLFLSGWPLVYFLRVMRYVFYYGYQACEFGYRHLSKKPALSPISSPTPGISRSSIPTRNS
uniref:Uncharacterized protein n=1 Tax=Panagrolaimus sp. ES5 TaxID=591445 RepID=A0AC34FF15_9BILA